MPVTTRPSLLVLGLLLAGCSGAGDTHRRSPSPTPTETPTDTPPATTTPRSLPANGRLVRAEDLFARALEPCSVITADYELATPGRTA